MHRTIFFVTGAARCARFHWNEVRVRHSASVALAPFMSAIFAATDVRLRQLPIDSEALIAEAAAHEAIGATSPARAEGKF